MALREIEFKVGADGALSPATEQIGGVQGEHKATEVVFVLNELYDELQEKLKENGKSAFVYYFNIVNGEGVEFKSDTALLGGKEVKLPLEYEITQHGGTVSVQLVIAYMRESADEKETFVLKSAQAKVKLAFSSHVNKKQEYEEMSLLAHTVKAKAKEAEEALKEIKTAREAIEYLLGSLENDGEFVFQGGNASGVVDVKFIIDEEISEFSRNAVANYVVAQYVANSIKDVKDTIEKYHPIGSIFIGTKDLDPNEIFGGKWEKLKVTRSIGGKIDAKLGEANTVTAFPVDVKEFCILTNEAQEGFHITVTPLSGAPQSCSVCAGGIQTHSEEEGEEIITYLAGFSVYAHRPTATPFPVFWHITGKSYTDDNGNYHWIRTA